MLMISEFEKKYGVGITTNHTAKMANMCSLSTACTANKYCKARTANPKMICSKCYANSQAKRYKGLREKLEKNTEVLTTVIIPKNDLPYLFSPSGLFRFEAFGDLINEIQVVNYFNMASANKQLKFALWTKNPWIIRKAIEAYNLKKPSNLVIIGSSYFLNESMTYQAYPFIDKVFTVYDKKTATEKNVNINCGGRSCATCRRCYSKQTGREVSELVK